VLRDGTLLATSWAVGDFMKTGKSTIHVNGVELEYLEAGTGIPVVFSHGSGSDLRYWEPQRAAFAARYRFVAYSRRFHGAGPWPAEGDYSAEAQVADLVEILRQLPHGPAHLVGFSTTIALRATLHTPDLIRSLTTIEPNVPWLLDGDPEGQAVLAWWRAENTRVKAEAAGNDVRAAQLWFELVNNRGPGTFATQPEGLRQMWLDNYNVKRPAAPAQEPLRCMELGAISKPTLALGAEYGMPYSRRIVEALAPCIPASRLVILPGVTHFMSYQEPAVFNATVLAFLAQHR
jgi:pimeloyl-ACP methyl ester carboxylesterase